MVGKVIVSLLAANESLTALVNEDNIYPYVINENTAIPAIVYTIDSLSTDYHKDGWNYDAVTFSIISFSDNYGTLQDVSAQVRSSLELEKGTTEGVTYERIYLTGMDEGYSITENVFMNRLTFTAQIKSYI